MVMHRRMPSSSLEEQEATPSPGQRVLRSGKEPIREPPAEKKKRKVATPPRHERRISIKDSPPCQCRKYMHRSESEDDDPKDKETLSSRAAHQGLATPSSG